MVDSSRIDKALQDPTKVVRNRDRELHGRSVRDLLTLKKVADPDASELIVVSTSFSNGYQ